MPPGIENAYLFQIFNTVSWQIVQGLPIILFFKFMGASDTVLGLAASLNPLMNMMQIPAASHVERIGYRSFVLRGWASRTFFVAAVMLVPILMYFLDRATCMVLTLFLLFIYSTLRGISSCGFLPWITQLIPEKVRGTYISKDQMYSSFAGLLTMFGVALLFYPQPGRISFSIVFLISFVAGLISLHFLRKMPDVPVISSSSSKEKVPLLKMFLFPPFFKLMNYNFVMNSAFAAANIFWVSLLRETFFWNDSQILFLSAFTTFVSMGVLWFFGKMIDRVGSLPLLHFAGAILIFHYSLWFFVAGRCIPLHWAVILVLGFTSGMGGPLFNLANTRLVMATVPEMGRSHFFALYSVSSSLALGILPIFWGIIMDALRNFHWHWGRLDLDHYAFLYLILTLTMVVGLRFRSSLKESRALSSEQFFRELLVDTPSKAITRLLRNRPFIG